MVNNLTSESQQMLARHNLFRNNAEEKMLQLVTEIEGLEFQLDGKELLIAEKEDELEYNQGIIEFKVGFAARLEERILELEEDSAEIATLRELIDTLETDIISLQRRTEELVYDLDGANARISSLNEQIYELSRNRRELETDSNVLAHELNRANQAVLNVYNNVNSQLRNATDRFNQRTLPSAINTDLPGIFAQTSVARE